MTRHDVMMQYTVSDWGYITDLGKFEGEQLYAPYFYDAVMNGDGERIGDADFLEITDEDSAQFPELKDLYGVTLVESDQGFVYVRAHSKAAYEMLKEDEQKRDEQYTED